MELLLMVSSGYITWKSITAAVTGLVTLATAIWKLLSMIKSSRSATEDKLAALGEENAVQREQITELRKDVEQNRKANEKLMDLLIKLLTGK